VRVLSPRLVLTFLFRVLFLLLLLLILIFCLVVKGITSTKTFLFFSIFFRKKQSYPAVANRQNPLKHSVENQKKCRSPQSTSWVRFSRLHASIILYGHAAAPRVDGALGAFEAAALSALSNVHGDYHMNNARMLGKLHVIAEC
jgi:hypothetical protein